MRFNGFFQARRGLEEHLYQGRINLLEYGIHRLITSQADPRDGIWFGSAKALWHCIGARKVSERQCRRILEDLTQKGYLKRFVRRGQKGNFAILVDKFLVTQGANTGKYVNAKKTRTWRDTVYEELPKGGELVASNEPTKGEKGATTVILDTRKEKQEKEHPAQASPSLIPNAYVLEWFNFFWEAYPRKVGKPAALKIWKKISFVGTELMAGLERWKQSEQWQDEKFIPYPATFLNQRRWEDQPTDVKQHYDPREPGLPGKCNGCGIEIPAGFLKCLKCMKKKAPVNP